jgi:hypothetical protein
VNDVFERMWKKEVMVCFKIVSQDLPGTSKEHNKNIQES